MDLTKDVFTTFDVAKVCNANITSIKNWIEQGEIEAFRTPGGHYRIKRADIESFLERHDMPNPFAALNSKRVLVIHGDNDVIARLLERLGSDYELHIAEDPIDGLIKLGQTNPRAVVVDSTIDEVDARRFCERVTSSDDLRDVRVIVCGLEEHEVDAVREAGAHHAVQHTEGDFGLLNALLTAVSPK